MQADQANEDWHRIYTVAGFSADWWLTLFSKVGFSRVDMFGDYSGNCYDKATSSTLLAVCDIVIT